MSPLSLLVLLYTIYTILYVYFCWLSFWANSAGCIVSVQCSLLDFSMFSDGAFRISSRGKSHSLLPTSLTKLLVLTPSPMCEKCHQLLAVGQCFPPGTPVSSTRKLISSSFHRLDMTLAVVEALNPNKPNQTKPNPITTGIPTLIDVMTRRNHNRYRYYFWEGCCHGHTKKAFLLYSIGLTCMVVALVTKCSTIQMNH